MQQGWYNHNTGHFKLRNNKFTERYNKIIITRVRGCTAVILNYKNGIDCLRSTAAINE